MPPCSRQDFMVHTSAHIVASISHSILTMPQEYLGYVSHDAENLQFFLWFEDYSRRFIAASKSEQALSPPWYKAEVPRPHSNDSNQTAATVFEPVFEEIEMPLTTIGAMIQDLRSDRIQCTSSSKLSHLDAQSLSSTTSTTLYRTESIEDADAHTGSKSKLCKYPLPTQIDTAKPSQPPCSHSVLRSIVSFRTISILARAGSSISQVKIALPFFTP